MSATLTPYEEFRKRLEAIPGVYSLKDFNEAKSTIDELQGSAREQFLATLVGSRHVWRPLLERSMWQQFASLAQFNQDPRIEDVAKGAVNAIVLLIEGFESLCAEYAELQEKKKEAVDPQNPLPEIS